MKGHENPWPGDTHLRQHHILGGKHFHGPSLILDSRTHTATKFLPEQANKSQQWWQCNGWQRNICFWGSQPGEIHEGRPQIYCTRLHWSDHRAAIQVSHSAEGARDNFPQQTRQLEGSSCYIWNYRRQNTHLGQTIPSTIKEPHSLQEGSILMVWNWALLKLSAKEIKGREWASPCFGVSNKSRTIWIVINLSQLTCILKRKDHPLPMINEMSKNICRSAFALVIDLNMGNLSIPYTEPT